MTTKINRLTQFNHQNVLVIGDVMIDRYHNGKVDRISPEAPVPIVHLKNTDNRLGGAANVALNLKALGANPILCSLIGKDENAAIFLDLLPTQGISTKGILQSSERMTTVKTRVLASNQQLLRIDQEDTHALSTKETMRLMEHLGYLLDQEKIDLIILQDYNKGVLSDEVISRIMQDAVKRNIPTAVDPKKANFFAFQNAHLFKPNLKEVNESLPFAVAPTLQSLDQAAAYIQEKLNNRYTLITLSDKGLYINDGQKSEIVPTQKRNITDVCGAGDSVISIAALAMSLSFDRKDIALLSNLAGGQVCEKVGVVPIDKNQLQNEYLRINVS